MEKRIASVITSSDGVSRAAWRHLTLVISGAGLTNNGVRAVRRRRYTY